MARLSALLFRMFRWDATVIDPTERPKLGTYGWAEEQVEIRRLVLKTLKEQGESYSVEIWQSMTYGEEYRRRTIPKIQRVLRALEDEGLIRGREVLPTDHRGSSLARRYYRIV